MFLRPESASAAPVHFSIFSFGLLVPVRVIEGGATGAVLSTMYCEEEHFAAEATPE